MKWKAECNFVRACGLNGHKLSQLSVKGIRWKDGKLYVFIRRFLSRDTLLADERFVPVVSGLTNREKRLKMNAICYFLRSFCVLFAFIFAESNDIVSVLRISFTHHQRT